MMMNLNLTFRNVFIHIGIVEFVPDEIIEEYESDDEYPELNIYEKIQMLKLENLYERIKNISPDTNNVSNGIPIPKSKK
jgi:hypothetical protein